MVAIAGWLPSACLLFCVCLGLPVGSAACLLLGDFALLLLAVALLRGCPLFAVLPPFGLLWLPFPPCLLALLVSIMCALSSAQQVSLAADADSKIGALVAPSQVAETGILTTLSTEDILSSQATHTLHAVCMRELALLEQGGSVAAQDAAQHLNLGSQAPMSAETNQVSLEPTAYVVEDVVRDLYFRPALRSPTQVALGAAELPQGGSVRAPMNPVHGSMTGLASMTSQSVAMPIGGVLRFHPSAPPPGHLAPATPPLLPSWTHAVCSMVIARL